MNFVGVPAGGFVEEDMSWTRARKQRKATAVSRSNSTDSTHIRRAFDAHSMCSMLTASKNFEYRPSFPNLLPSSEESEVRGQTRGCATSRTVEPNSRTEHCE